MGIKELLQKRNDPDGYLQAKMKDIFAELESFKEEVMTSIRKEVEKAKEGIMSAAIFLDLDPAKKIAEQTAREEIANTKIDISGKVENMLVKIDEKAEKAFAKIDMEAEAAIEKASKHIDAIADEIRDSLAEEVAGITAKIENLRGPEGLRGENGMDGIDGVSAQNIDLRSVVSLVLAQIPTVTPNITVENVNKSTKKINMSVIAGLIQEFQSIKSAISRVNTSKSGGGGGMGAVINQQFDGDASTTTFALTYNVAGNSTAVIGCRYNGQMLYLGDQFTISGKVLTTTFTPEASTKVEITYIRT